MRLHFVLLTTVLACGDPTVTTTDGAASDAAVTVADAGMSSTDTGMPSVDAGMMAVDAGMMAADAGMLAVDAGTLAGCAAPTGVVEHATDIVANETWVGGTTHLVKEYITVRAPATLTIEPCAVVQVAANRTITVRGDTSMNTARLIARGTADRPIRFERRVASDAWGGIRGYNASSPIDLAYVELDGGGGMTGNGATLELNGENIQGAPSPVITVDHTVISHSKGYGVLLLAAAAFTSTSRDLTIRDSGEAVNAAVLSLTIAALATLPTGSYTGNFADVIRVEQSLDVTSDLTIRNFGVPIHFVFGRVQVVAKVAPFPVVTLTVEPGAELRFDDYISFGIVGGGGEHTGVLRAIGTAAAKIIFTSAKSARAAGDWPGIWLRSAQGSQLDHVVIEYAGGPNGIISNNCRPAMSTDNAALTVGNFTASYVPSAASFTNLEIRDTSSHAINAAWSAAAFGPDLTGGVSFARNAGCRQTKNNLPAGCGMQQGCLVD
jgi:hypothetical protein